uniref:Uncharacterized protein n=1 Tax=Sus scrofa TaxID=9823 RepID=A0A8D0J957_PIG
MCLPPARPTRLAPRPHLVRWGLSTLGGFSISPEPGPLGIPEIDSEGSEKWTCLRSHSGPGCPGAASPADWTCAHALGDGQVDFEEFVTLLGPKLSTSGIPEKFHGTDFDTVFWKCDMQKLTVDELKRLLYDTFCEHLSMKDIENIIMTEEESHLGTAEECPVDVETCSNQQIRQTCVRKSLICAFAIAFIISVMLIAANQVLRSGMK